MSRSAYDSELNLVEVTAEVPTVLVGERLVSLAVAAELIPMTSLHALYVWLGRHPEIPRRYKTMADGKGHNWEIRLLTEDDIRLIRSMVVHGYDESRYGRRRVRQLTQRHERQDGEAEPVTFNSLFR